MTSPKTYADIPQRASSISSPEVEALFASLPPNVRDGLVALYLKSNSSPIQGILDHFIDNSTIFGHIHRSPGSALAFEYLYTRQVSTPIDQYFIDCKAGFQISQRLLSLEENLPRWLHRLLNQRQSILVDNIGSGTGRDTIGVLAKNRRLAAKVKVRHIDPDTESLRISEKLAQDLGISDSFSFHGTKLGDVPSLDADLALVIGILCPLRLRASKVVLRNMAPYVRRGGIVIFSTALHKMVIEDPFTDFLMRFVGWHMTYKSEEESENLAKSLGWRVVGTFFDEPRRYHCMVVAEIP